MSARPAAGLLVEGLRVAYRRGGRPLPVLRGVDLEIAPGEVYGLVGESGCGKTTLGLALLGALPRGGRVEGGRVELDGHRLLELPPKELRAWYGSRLALVSQEPGRALNPALRIGVQVAEVHRGGRLGRRASLAAACRLLARVGLQDPEGMLGRYPHQLSGGQQQRVAIAMALAGNPRLLVLDEPTTALDTSVQAEILALLERLRGELDAAMLFITHNLALVGRLCERIGVLYGGRIVEDGPARQVLAHPTHPYTAGLLGCVPDLTRPRGARLVPVPGALPAPDRPPPGCAFAPRCGIAQPRCHSTRPPLEATGTAGQRSRCLFPTAVRVPAAAQRPGRPLSAREAPTAPAAGRRRPALAPDAPALLAARGLTKRYGRLAAVDDLSVDIHAGQTLGLVGESGSGKTTLARLLVGLLAPDRGQVLLDGRPLPASVARRDLASVRALQMVFQDPDATLNPSRRIRATLRRAIARLGGDTTAEALAAQTLLDAELLEQRPAALSGGQKQRVAIARALAGAPRLVVCDEPVSALDVSVQAAILNLLADLQASRRIAYLLISHDLGVVRYLAHRIAVMYRGHLVEHGPAEAVLRPPHHPYTEVLLRAVPTLDPAGARRPLAPADPSRRAAGPPGGCRFVSRCPRKLGPICDAEPPPLRPVGDGHLVRCHHDPVQLAALQAGGPGPDAAEEDR